MVDSLFNGNRDFLLLEGCDAKDYTSNGIVPFLLLLLNEDSNQAILDAILPNNYVPSMVNKEVC